MEKAAGDEKTRYILQKRYNAVGCLVCKSGSHTHLSCPSRPCYLCKKPGHLSHACPFRLKPGAHAAALRVLLAARQKRARLGYFLRARELDPSPTTVHPSLLYFRNPQFDCKAALGLRRVHSKRITAVEWHPEGRHTVTADKSGAVRVWNLGAAVDGPSFNVNALPKDDATVSYVHHCNVNVLAFDPNDREVMYTSSSDGIVCATRLSLVSGANRRAARGECVRERDTVVNLNPDGWQGPNRFKMAYGMAYDGKSRNCLYIGTSHGSILRRDPRESAEKAPAIQGRFHKHKVTTIHLNPLSSDLIATASNDRKVCLWDARKFVPGHEIGSYMHGRAVTSAYFSPNTGSRLLTTSLDNKIQIWSDIHAFSNDVNSRSDGAPTEIIHSHNFHRHLNAFRATWDPKDWKDDLFMCGRFLGDAYYEGGDESTTPVVLHPIDLFSAKAGTLVSSLVDSVTELICTTNRFSPVSNLILTAASGDLIMWSPPQPGSKRKGVAKVKGSRDGTDSGDSSSEEVDTVERKRRLKARTVLAKRSTRSSARRKAAS